MDQKNKIKKTIITKSNALIDSFYTLSLREHQLLAFAISQIPRTDILLEDLTVTINLHDFKSYYGLQRITYAKLNKIVEDLGKRTFKYIDDGKLKTRNWSYGYDEAIDKSGNKVIEQNIDIKFHKDVLPFLTGLSKTNPYTMYMLEITKDFKSKHTFPFYEMLARTRNMREDVFTISIDQLRKKLCLEGYKSFKNLRIRVIEPIFKDLEESTLLNIDWQLIKKGRSYTHIQVIFKEDSDVIPPKKKKGIKPEHEALRPKKVTEEMLSKHAKPGESRVIAFERLKKMLAAGVEIV